MAKKTKQPDRPGQVQTVQETENREFLAASITPESLDAERRSVDVVWFTGIDIARYDYFRGEPYILRFDLAGADLSLLNTGAPVLDNHDTWMGTASQKGVVERAWRDDSEFKATLRFSKRDEVDGLWRDIADKIVQKFSMGVNLLAKKELEQEKGKTRVVVVTKWQPFEISTAPLPADNNTRTLSQETEAVESGLLAQKEQAMPETVKTTGEEAREEPKQPPPVVVADEQLNSARETGVTGEKGRITAILRVAKVCGLEQSFAEKHIAENTSIEAFRKIAIDEQAIRASRGPEVRTAHAEILRDESDTRRRCMTGALLERFDPGKWTYDDHDREFRFHLKGGQRFYDGARQFAACTLLDIAKESLAAQGINWRSKSRTEIAQLAFQSTSDFPFILADVANKTLRAGYDMVPADWRMIAARRTAPDFKTVKELTLDSSSRLELVRESGEFHRGKLIEGKETWVLKTYGKIISITRQAIINDDLGAFTRTPQLMGQEVAMLEADTVFGIITTNGNLADGNPLFHANHSNLVSSGATISVDSLGTSRALMLLQTSPGGKPLNIPPRFLLAPAALAQLAEQYTSTNYQAATSANINPLAGRLTPIIDSRLDADDDAVWYLFGDPNTPNGTVLVYAYLEGQEGPYTETRNGFDVDGVEIKIRHDFASAAVDYRGAVKNPGA
jgi:hypothetical protein